MAPGWLLAQYRQLYGRMEQAWQRWCELQVSAATIDIRVCSRTESLRLLLQHPVLGSPPTPNVLSAWNTASWHAMPMPVRVVQAPLHAHDDHDLAN